MGYWKQPDLRPLGFQPTFDGMDGTYNRATTPEKNNVPGVSDDPARTLFASRRMARGAIGVEPLYQDMWRRPAAYANAKRLVIIDLEGAEWIRLADQDRATARERLALIQAMCDSIDAMRAEAASYGQTLQVGAYMPGLFVTRDSWPGDPRWPVYMKSGPEDWKPWYDRVDCWVPECSFSTEDVEAQKKLADEQFKLIHQVTPDKPIIVNLQLCYAHGMPDSNPKKWTLVPVTDYAKYVSFLANHPDVSGVSLFGGYAVGTGGAETHDNGTIRLDYAAVQSRVTLTSILVKAANRSRVH